jgi:hypothetical protein
MMHYHKEALPMYKLLIFAIINSSGWNVRSNAPDHSHSSFHAYPDDMPRQGYIRVPLLSYARAKAWEALSHNNPELSAHDSSNIRWRAALSPAPSHYFPHGFDTKDAMLELFDINMKLIAEFPLDGPKYAALPLVQRLGIELLWRTEINPNGLE